MKRIIPFLYFLISIPFLSAQPGVFSEIRIATHTPDLMNRLTLAGIASDHFHKSTDGKDYQLILSSEEIQRLEEMDLAYEVVTPDMTAHFLVNNTNISEMDCGLQNFSAGSMGGYHTYTEMVSQLVQMSADYPDFVSLRLVGTSFEGQTIYGIKISDNPLVDESAIEGVAYFDALTHAREPMSLEASLYYMWWLLENQASDPVANYLVHNRELYFIPVVNPDGYVYNETMNPQGGGLWRKNRRTAGGCVGVDLNRNYGHQWGLDSGSSSDPCTEIYRGTAAFSEPESQAVRNFLTEINPAIAFSIHTYGDVFLNPFGYAEVLPTYETYAEFSSEFIPASYTGYGVTAQMLGSTSSGTTRDYLHSQGIFAWTPEIGESFWEPASVICDRVQTFLKPMQFLSWVSGDYTCFHDFTILEDQPLVNGNIIDLVIRVKNRGLTHDAQNVEVILTSTNSDISILEETKNFGTVPSRSFADNEGFPFQLTVNDFLIPGERLAFPVTVKQSGFISYQDTIYLTAGSGTVFFLDEAEQGMVEWTTASFLLPWDTTFMDFTSGAAAFADSRYGNYPNNNQSEITMVGSVDLTDAIRPRVEFNAKWSLEPGFDICYFEASPDGGNNWLELLGQFTNNSLSDPGYTGHQHWVQEVISLESLRGFSDVKFRFRLSADQGVNCDGFYFDDFKVIDFLENPLNTDDSQIPLKDLAVMPNPNSGSFDILFNSTITEIANIELFNLLGRKVFSDKMSISQGDNTLKVQQNQLPAGVYFLRLKMIEFGMVSKIMVN